jgi:hypothetical protein
MGILEALESHRTELKISEGLDILSGEFKLEINDTSNPTVFGWIHDWVKLCTNPCVELPLFLGAGPVGISGPTGVQGVPGDWSKYITSFEIEFGSLGINDFPTDVKFRVNWTADRPDQII